VWSLFDGTASHGILSEQDFEIQFKDNPRNQNSQLMLFKSCG